MAACPFLIKNSLVLEKCLQPKNLPPASGLGCAAFKTMCCGLFMSLSLACASFPHSKKTMGTSRSLRWWSTVSVNLSHPCLAWLLLRRASTVSTELRSITPLLAQFMRCPLLGMSHPMSLCSSLKILTSEGGVLAPGRTENASP